MRIVGCKSFVFDIMKIMRRTGQIFMGFMVSLVKVTMCLSQYVYDEKD